MEPRSVAHDDIDEEATSNNEQTVEEPIEGTPVDVMAGADLGGLPIALASSNAGTCLLRRGGTVWCWGSNANYQAMGANYLVDYQLVPRLVRGVREADAIALGMRFGCARTADGVWCWGTLPRSLPQADAQEGVSPYWYETPALVPQLPAGELIAGHETLCVLHASVLSCWSNHHESFGVSEAGGPVEGLGPVVEVALGSNHASARNDAGEVWSWGYDGTAGTEPDGRARNHGPARIRLPAPALSISAEHQASCALLRDRRVFCWGLAFEGVVELRRLRGATEIDVTSSSVCGTLHPNGRLRCLTRRQDCAQSPCRTVTDETMVPGVKRPDAFVISAFHGCMLIDGNVSCWGTPGSLGEGSAEFETSPVPVAGVTNAVRLQLGMDQTYIQLADGRVLHYGGEGQMHVGREVDWLRGSAGFDIPCQWDGEGVVHCRSSYGRGDEVVPFRGAEEVTVQGQTRARCARFPDGTVRCQGTLNNGQRLSAEAPVEDLGPVAEMCANSSFCFRERSGRVACALNSANGRRGPASLLTMVDDAIAIGCASGFSCAARRDGTVTCWGELSRIGTPRDEERFENDLRTVPGIDDAVGLAGGRLHMCALRRGGAVSCWGQNYAGQLGDGTATTRYEARPVPGIDDAVEVAGGRDHSCIRHRSGAVSCFGNPHDRAFGTERPGPVETPVAIRLPE